MITQCQYGIIKAESPPIFTIPLSLDTGLDPAEYRTPIVKFPRELVKLLRSLVDLYRYGVGQVGDRAGLGRSFMGNTKPNTSR
jgi:hypothetical protein